VTAGILSGPKKRAELKNNHGFIAPHLAMATWWPYKIDPHSFSYVRRGSKRLDSISDYCRHGFILRVVCQGYGRAAVINSQALSMARLMAGKNRDAGAVQCDPKCRARGSRDVKCGPTERSRQ
jgi:hypothetical protein